VGFWASQRQSWQALGGHVARWWRNGSPVVLIGCLCGIVGAAAILVTAYNYWAHEDDVTISTYKDGDEIPRCVPSLNGKGKVKPHHQMWVVVEFLDTKGHTRIRFARRAAMSDDTWIAHSFDVGGVGQKLSPYTLAVVDVDEATDAALGSTVVKTTHRDVPQVSYAKYPSGAHRVAHVSVTRRSGNDPTCGELVQQARTKH
jgi:hypothetical protein